MGIAHPPFVASLLADATAAQQRDGALRAEVGVHRRRRQVQIGHGGAWAGYRAQTLCVTDARRFVACVVNRPDLEPSRICRKIVLAASQQ